MNNKLPLSEYLKKLDKQLKGYNIPLNSLLQEGFSRDYVDDEKGNIPISFFDELYDLYAW